MTLHVPVLKEEVIKLLNIKENDVVVDATLGGGGHSREILRIIKQGTLVAIDADKKATIGFEKKKDEKIVLVNENFSKLTEILKRLKIKKVNAVLADLGWSSDQMEDPEKGMSFIIDGGLDMRLDSSQKMTARDIINKYSQEDLERVIKQFGEERFYRRIANEIVRRRKNKEIKTTLELAEAVRKAVPKKFQSEKMHPATKTFQAIRIEVNQELKNLELFIPQAIETLKPGGRLAIISFHSLEDRIVKNIFRQNARGCICPTNFPLCTCGKKAIVKILTSKPVLASEKEILINQRSRSAKLRVCEKI
jgi:16S rRNA (cytosine1402-N4)-methyltransferase